MFPAGSNEAPEYRVYPCFHVLDKNDDNPFDVLSLHSRASLVGNEVSVQVTFLAIISVQLVLDPAFILSMA